MAVKKALRIRKPARGRKAIRTLEPLRADWMRTRGIPAVLGFVALIAVFAFAYSTSAPSVSSSDRRTENAGAPREVTPAETPAAAPEQASTGDVPLAADRDLRRAEAADDAKPAVVTLTGCLERSDKEFRLNDTTGAKAPKSRSWKSGFLTKRPAAVELVPVGAIPLSNYVGHRVTVTGTLVEREMRVRSLRRVAASCDDAPRVRA